MLKSWQRWTYFSQWLIAAGAVAQCWQTGLWLRLPAQSPWMYVFVFTSTLLLYLFHFRFYWVKTPVNDRQLFFRENRRLMLLQFALAALLLVVSFFKTGIHFLFPIAVLGVCAGAYTYFIYKPRQHGIFKYNGFFKILTLTFVWMAVTAVLPVAASGLPLFSPPFLFYYLQRYLLMLAICLPFDVRDVETDKRRGNLTLPVYWGKEKTFRVCYWCLLLQAVLPFAALPLNWYDTSIMLANIAATLLTIYSVYYCSRHLKDDFSWFLLDANLVLRAVLLGSVRFF